MKPCFKAIQIKKQGRSVMDRLGNRQVFTRKADFLTEAVRKQD